MPNWHRFTPADFEYDFDRDELATHYRMATMSAKAKLTEFEIDQKVIAQADDNAAWEKPILVRRTRAASLSIPPDLAARAAFLAKLHRKPSLEEWLTRVIQERIELEEAAFIGAKQELAAKTG